jgi:hypothetical protein
LNNVVFRLACTVGFDDTIARFDVFVVTTNPFTSDMTRILIVTEHIGEGLRGHNQSSAVAGVLGDYYRQQQDECARYAKAVDSPIERSTRAYALPTPHRSRCPRD